MLYLSMLSDTTAVRAVHLNGCLVLKGLVSFPRR